MTARLGTRITKATNRRSRRRPLPAPKRITPATGGYPYRVGPWDQHQPNRPPCPAGMCEGCHNADWSSTTPGLPYVSPRGGLEIYHEWEPNILWLCPDCLACCVIEGGRVGDYRRYPPLLAIRETNGTFTTSQRTIRVARKSGAVTLQAITATGERLAAIVLRDDVHEWRLREAYATVARGLDAADPLPPFVPPVPHRERLLLKQ